MDTIYRQLARKINGMGMGLPETDEGYELVYLKELYTEEEAEFALAMPLGLHTPEEFAADMDRDPQETEAMLKKMADDDLVLRVHEGDVTRYYLMPIIHGFLELNLPKFNTPIANSFGRHYVNGMGARFFGSKAPLFRIIPSSRDLVEDDACLPYDDPHAIIDRNDRFALTKCFCRMSANWGKDSTCRYNPDYEETCMVMGIFADFYLENGMAREITKEEAHAHMLDADKNGTIVEVINSENVEVMCQCCKCCCGVVKALIMFGGEAAGFASNYQVRYDASKCVNCGKCAERCHVGACKVNKRGRLKVDPDRCIGCGLCVSGCPSGALTLHRKPVVYMPPAKTCLGMYDYVRTLRRKAGEI